MLSKRIETKHVVDFCRWVVLLLIGYALILFVWSFLIKINILRPQAEPWRIFERYEPADWLQILLVVVGFLAFGVLYAFTVPSKTDH